MCTAEWNHVHVRAEASNAWSMDLEGARIWVAGRPYPGETAGEGAWKATVADRVRASAPIPNGEVQVDAHFLVREATHASTDLDNLLRVVVVGMRQAHPALHISSLSASKRFITGAEQDGVELFVAPFSTRRCELPASDPSP
jgi:hypothetical protein